MDRSCVVWYLLVTEVFFLILTSGHGQVQRPCDPGQPVRMGSLCSPGEVQRHALPAFQQRRPSGKGLFSHITYLESYSVEEPQFF